MSTDKAQSWLYAEEFIPEDEVLLAARAEAADLGADPVSTGVGAALRAIASLGDTRAVLEIGTGVGVSGLWLLRGMAEGGVLTTIDHEPEFHRVARRIFQEAGVSPQRTRLISGRALDVLPRMAPGGYDLVVIDADVRETPEYVEHALRVLRPGGTVVVTHALWHDRVADPARRDPETVVMRETLRVLRESDGVLTTLLPVGDGLLLATRR